MQFNQTQGDVNTIIAEATITEAEKAILDLLAKAWNKFCELPSGSHLGAHHLDRPEFMKAIHEAQNIVLARVGMRSIGGWPDVVKGP